MKGLGRKKGMGLGEPRVFGVGYPTKGPTLSPHWTTLSQSLEITPFFLNLLNTFLDHPHGEETKREKQSSDWVKNGNN